MKPNNNAKKIIHTLRLFLSFMLLGITMAGVISGSELDLRPWGVTFGAGTGVILEFLNWF